MPPLKFAPPRIAAAVLLSYPGIATFAGKAMAQGCVASRCALGATHGVIGRDTENEARWQVSLGYRWFRSDRQFTGSHEDNEVDDEGGQDINDSHFFDLNINYQWTPRFSLNLAVPFVNNDRSSVVRNLTGTILERYHVQSNGLADIRLAGSYWIFDPLPHPQGKEPGSPPRGNIQLSAGIDMPTGDDDVKDTHRRYNRSINRVMDIVLPVDQSIQPGDGGWGILFDIYGYYRITDRLNGYLNGSYQITPGETNGVLTGRGNAYERVMSIPDTYSARAGFDYALDPKNGVTVSLGLRAEGVPVYDLTGGSEGFRRPGVAVSIEPGISIMSNNWTASLSVPVAIYRNRLQSVPEKEMSEAFGVKRHGEASFADYLIQLTIGKRF